MPLKSKQRGIISLFPSVALLQNHARGCDEIGLLRSEIKVRDVSRGWSAHSFLHKPSEAAFSHLGAQGLFYSLARTEYEESVLGLSFLDKGKLRLNMTQVSLAV